MYLKHYKINGGTTTQMHQLIRTKDFHLNLYSRVQSWQSKKGKGRVCSALIILTVDPDTKTGYAGLALVAVTVFFFSAYWWHPGHTVAESKFAVIHPTPSQVAPRK